MGLPLKFKNEDDNESVYLYIQESTEDLSHTSRYVTEESNTDETFLPDEVIKDESKKDVHLYKNPQAWNRVDVLDILRRSYSLSQNALMRHRHGSDTCPIEDGNEDESELQTTPLHSKVLLSRSCQFTSNGEVSANIQSQVIRGGNLLTSAALEYEPTTSLISEVILSTTAPFIQDPQDLVDPLSRASSSHEPDKDKICQKPRKAVRFISLQKSDSRPDNVTLNVANTASVMPPLDDNISTATNQHHTQTSCKYTNWKVWTCVGIAGFYILCTGALVIGMAQERKSAPLSWMGG